jgi:2-amino-4-hydroxy-6-hydroxymethyldihydropteridine diphosphokinase
MDASPLQVVVAFGSNLGDSESLIRWAMDRIESRSVGPLRRSSLWTSTPMDCPPGSPRFLNAVAILTPVSGDSPESMLRFLQSLEVEAGRRPKVVLNEARPLDLDLIAWGPETRASVELTLPHPRAQVRRFVLQPLAELEPEFRFPGAAIPISETLRQLPPDDQLRVFRGPG